MKPSVGQAIDRVDGPLKVTGQARYAGEFSPAGLCYAACRKHDSLRQHHVD